MTDNITLPRKHIDYAAHALEHFNKDAPDPLVSEIIHYLRTALAAPRPEPVAYFDLQKQVFYWAKPTMIDVPMTVALKPFPLYASAAAAAPEPVRHPGYIIGNHWLETAYSRVCMGEAEADVLRDCGWQRVADIDALLRSVEDLRRAAERWRHWGGSHGFATIDHEGGRCFVTLVCDAPDPDQALAKRFAEQDFDEWLGAFTDAAMEASTAPAAAAVDASTAPEAKP